MATDFDALLNAQCLGAFGEVMSYTPSGEATFLVKAIEKRPREWEPVEPGTLAVRWVRLTDFRIAPANGDAVQIGNDRFAVVDIRADGGGGAYLSLGRVR